MRFWARRCPPLAVISVIFSGCLAARDDLQLALSLKAQTDFDRVALSAAPPLADTATCAQSQAAMLAVSPPEDLALLHYRKGYCLLAGATVTASRRDFSAAAAELDQAVEAWPMRIRKPVKGASPEPMSGGLRALDGVAHLQVQGEAAALPLLSAAVASPVCSANVMSEPVCRQWVEIGREWLGRIALRAGKVEEAIADFKGAPDTGWEEWALGRRAFDARDYAQAVSRYSSAIETWKAIWNGPGPGFVRRLGPRPQLGSALEDLGGAQLLGGNPKTAVLTLDASLRVDPASARAFYLRARARELAGQGSEALADYNLAARAAFAASQDLASGEAHLYRGILLFRRKDYTGAEDEFSSALNFSIAGSMRPDAEAWRYLAAVAAGSCSAARQNLQHSLGSVSPYFPKDEARATAAACRVASD
jgi:tetratricopeptide (TPR) repeat protein